MLLNAGPIATTILADPGPEDAGDAFAYGVLMARIPLFLFQAVQAALLPRLSRLAARNELGEFRAGLSGCSWSSWSSASSARSARSCSARW